MVGSSSFRSTSPGPWSATAAQVRQDVGARPLPRPRGQRALVQAWWEQLDEVSRRRLLRLAPEDFLPPDAALDLQMLGVTVIAVGTVAVEDGYDALYEQPADVIELLAGVRGGHPG
jgi:hypothetical protein